MKVVL